MSIDEELKKENNKALAYIHNKKPFQFIDYLKNKYSLTNNKNDLYNLALDDYNWLIKNGVVTNTIYFSLKRLTNNILTKYYKGNNDE